MSYCPAGGSRNHMGVANSYCYKLNILSQGVVIPIGAVVTAATGVKKRSRGQGLFLVSVKRSRTIFKLGNSGQDINVLRMRIAHSVVKCVWSNSQGPICGAVKRSSNKNDGQNFLTPVAAVTTAPIGVTTPCVSLLDLDQSIVSVTPHF